MWLQDKYEFKKIINPFIILVAYFNKKIYQFFKKLGQFYLFKNFHKK